MPTTSTYLMLYTSVFLIATNGLFAKGIPLDAVSITALRALIAALAIGLVITAYRRFSKIPTLNVLIGIYGLGVLVALHWATFFHSMQVSTIAVGMLSLFTFPVMVVFLEAAVHKRWPYKKDLLSATLVLTGVFMMVAAEPITINSTTLQGVLWGVLSALLFACRNVAQKYYFTSVPSDTLMLHQMIGTVLILFYFVDTVGVVTLDKYDWLAVIALGLFSTAAAHTLLVISYKRLPAKSVAMISCLQPVIAALLGWFIIGEPLSLLIIAGGTIIVSVAVYETLL